MGIPNRTPLRVAGSSVNSGNVNTGEWLTTRGGGQCATIYSGWNSGTSLVAAGGNAGPAVLGGSDVLFVSGAGRLNTIIPLLAASGVGVTFYDAAVATSGGPFVSSGHKILGVLPPNTWNGTSVLGGPAPIPIDVPFQSGLCAAVRSGCAGFSITWTPETNPPAVGN